MHFSFYFDFTFYAVILLLLVQFSGLHVIWDCLANREARLTTDISWKMHLKGGKWLLSLLFLVVLTLQADSKSNGKLFRRRGPVTQRRQSSRGFGYGLGIGIGIGE